MAEDEQSGTDWFSHPDLWNEANLIPLQGQTNRNYRVNLQGREFHLKVRKHDGFPGFKKLRYVDELLSSHEVPHAPVIETIVHHERFPHGAILFEWIEGRSIASLSEYEELLPGVVAMLREIHTIRAPYFENTDLGLRATSYADFITGVLRARMERCRKESLLDQDIETRLTSFLSTVRCGQDVPPALVHRDATKSNVLLRSNGLPMLIDWDNAEFAVPLADVARIIFAYQWNFDVDKRNRILSQYLGAQAGEGEKDILAVEYVRNALEGLIFKDADPQYCRTVIGHILQ